MLIQPTDRETAAGILFPIHWVARQDPDAIVAVFPSDHFVSEPVIFMALVARIAAWVHEHPARLVLLGAHPTSPEVDYGWIELGRPLDSTDDRQMWEVGRFWEKPSKERARLCLEAGCLWNTLVMVGTATMFSAQPERRFQKFASAWPGQCPSSKLMRKPFTGRMP